MGMTDSRSITKTCVKCKKDKNLTEYTKDGQKKTGLAPYCKACRKIMSRKSYENNKEVINRRSRENYKKVGKTKKYRDQRYSSHIKRNYGITITEYNDMFIEQAGRCAICGTHQSSLTRRLLVDHCHETGMVRGLLCYNCNTGLGQFGDSLQLIKNTVKYLEADK